MACIVYAQNARLSTSDSAAKFGQYDLTAFAAVAESISGGRFFSINASHAGVQSFSLPSSSFFSESGVAGAALTSGWVGAGDGGTGACLQPAMARRVVN